ncbi:Mitochondrial acidic protein mam33 [Exophiala xenobiotica]|uniref:Mitochondrial acidic protein mam33 n=1 Tax=Vermiconidia calcicola TaxID=1690605 RepID=A0AAV9Q402_9PEZI|nr:Mitochondrial acidic protein mam33 [Exophiala xenobiotica]KAK5533470.1 Mitochondrial acidic protein mam33 [Vermiconidia calcicola]KAK5542931.1 Mitochondrial acidic protein mam33 [Chaetothyriales sp. CCFEE 6169]KAK5203956.1 Mitochondrial acidic protein mam33 [Exophiala xenobiotica]KAK5216588.1 Mitochondrial acidic protein mam33 [Exophiala xenobiotica]
MNSLRLFSRALPKASLRQSAIRYSSSVSRFTARRATWQPAMRTSYPAFSTSTICREPAGDSDLELAEKLNSERQLELENNDESTVAAIDDFLKTHPWEVQDKPGTHEVTLTREFGNEKIKVALSVAEIDNMPEEDEFGGLDEDGALEDEADYGSNKATINQSGTRGGKVDVMPEDSIAPADREGEDAAGMAGETPAYPIHLTITITKPGKKALEVRAVAQEGTIEIDTISFFPKESLLEAQTPKDAQEARNLYAGPAIGNLDPDLQAMLEKYLEERGIDAELAGFLFEYVDYKEQREYVKWLDDVKAFVEE